MGCPSELDMHWYLDLLSTNIEYEKSTVVSNIQALALRGEFDVTIDSHLWFAPGGPPSSLHDMYPDIGLAGTPGAELIPDLRGVGLQFVQKYQYSCFAGGSNLEEYLLHKNITEVAIVGINTDYCVLATALDAFAARFRTYVVQDAVSSFHGRAGHEIGLKMIRQYLGDVCVNASHFLRGDSTVSVAIA